MIKAQVCAKLQYIYIFTRKVQKRATAVLFTNSEDCVVISDKAGDVYRLVLEKKY